MKFFACHIGMSDVPRTAFWGAIVHFTYSMKSENYISV